MKIGASVIKEVLEKAGTVQNRERKGHGDFINVYKKDEMKMESDSVIFSGRARGDGHKLK